jgi:hypothetical protein
MLLKWLPWRWLVHGLARAHGLLDPLRIIARLENIAQPSEVAAPIELLRSGLALHARGVINGKVIQQNLDWVWPFWARRQFDPTDPAFVPRAFAFAQVNLSHRNWTAVGAPGCEAMPVVDPRGLLTPLFDGWSLDAWAVPETGSSLMASREGECIQELLLEEESLAVRTETTAGGLTVRSRAFVEAAAETARCHVDYEADLGGPGWLVVALRPFNPEGVGLIERIDAAGDATGWSVDGHPCIRFDRPAERFVSSTYHAGDVAIGLRGRPPSRSCRCEVGLATAAAMFPADDSGKATARATVDLSFDKTIKTLYPRGRPESWGEALAGCAELDVPDDRFDFLYRAAVRSIAVLSPDDSYPGPYTYKRFWFRDAALILHAVLCANMPGRARQGLKGFLERQRVSGYFHSQSGEWDSNGQVLWLLGRLVELTGEDLPGDWRGPVERGARWIRHKRIGRREDPLHAGLLPAGFSAEHLGTNDYYYWDDFWSVSGLRAAADLSSRWGREDDTRELLEEAGDLSAAIDHSLEASRPNRSREGIPASPYRRMDSGCVGSLACSYPLSLFDGRDARVLGTLEYLLNECMIGDMFFLDISHSGLNPYLTLTIAQALLRAGDERCFALVRAVAEAASPTGQWPEAIHPRTGGGCMGDGQHAWASAEWIMMMRSLFLREEAGRLVLTSGIPRVWLEAGRPMSFGPTPTIYGPVTVRVRPGDGVAEVSWEADWRSTPPAIEVRLAGQTTEVEDVAAGKVSVPLK